MGVFIPTGGWWYQLFTGDVGNGSVNQVCIGLGYDPSQVQTVMLFDRPDGISDIGVLPFTREVLFVLIEEHVKKIRTSQVERVLSKLDWEFENSPINVEELLDHAIETEAWSVVYLQRIFPDLEAVDDQVYHNQPLGLYLIIKDGRLIDYSSADGLDKWGKELNELNPGMVNGWLGEGFLLHGDHEKAIIYVNLQANAWANLPESMNNEYVPAYTRKDGTIDFFMILAAEMKAQVGLVDFELRIGTKRAANVRQEGDAKVHEYQGKQFYFKEGVLQDVR